MDDCLPLESLSTASLRALVAHERAKRAEADRDLARLQAGIARQNERILTLERENAELRRTVATLQEMVAGLTEQNALLRQRMAQLEQENAQLRGTSRPAKHHAEPWPSETTKSQDEPKVRKQRDRRHNHGRQRMDRVDERVQHVVEQCPHCGTDLHGGWVHRRVQVIELPPQQRVQVIEHQLIARRCPTCARRVLPAPPNLDDGRVGRSRFGPRLIALVATMATVERLPGRQIQERLAREYDLQLSHGGIIGLLRLVAERGKDAYEQLQRDIRGSPVVHADETGWREGGVPGFIWSFSTPTTRYYHYDGSRAGAVADAVLGADFGGTLVSDFYAAYDHFEGEKQRCWAHLWRDIEALTTEHPTDEDLAAWVVGIRAIWDRATGVRPAQETGESVHAVRARRRRAEQYERELLALCPETIAAHRPEATLAKRIRRYLAELFTFVRDSAVPTTNNAAERSVRPLVIGRKISGGTRSAAGSAVRMVLASLAGTGRLQGNTPEAVFLQVLLTRPASATHTS
jgi:transposase